jgi:hypothetical protein
MAAAPGLNPAIPNGAIVSYSGTWPNTTAFTPDAVVGDVNQTLQISGWVILSYQITSDVLGMLGLNETFQLIAQIANQSGMDVDGTVFLGILDDAVTQETGAPFSESITGVTGANGTPIATGQGGQTAPVAAAAGTAGFACGDPSWGFFQNPVQWVKCLASGATSTLGLIFIGLLVGIVLIVAANPAGAVERARRAAA